MTYWTTTKADSAQDDQQIIKRIQEDMQYLRTRREATGKPGKWKGTSKTVARLREGVPEPIKTRPVANSRAIRP